MQEVGRHKRARICGIDVYTAEPLSYMSVIDNDSLFLERRPNI
jgi:hypothetical protein